MTDVPINEQAAKLRELKSSKDEAKAEYESLNKQFKAAQQALIDRMEDTGTEGLKVAGTNFVPTKTIYGQIQDRTAFIEWAQENEPELIEHRERKELLNELARELLNDGEPFPPGMSFRVQEYISQRAA